MGRREIRTVQRLRTPNLVSDPVKFWANGRLYTLLSGVSWRIGAKVTTFGLLLSLQFEQ